MLSLRHRPFWITLSVLLVLTVIWGSLQTAFATDGPHGFDKVEHFSTYFFLAVWFTGLYRRPRYWLVVIALLALGGSMELTQYLMRAGRTADAYDMLANTAGVTAGLVLALLATGGWAARMESAWLRKAN